MLIIQEILKKYCNLVREGKAENDWDKYLDFQYRELQNTKKKGNSK